ncbi:MAG TPA: PEP-CTERM sorting domain-containing protein [Verrucomicrobiae bacterium]
MKTTTLSHFVAVLLAAGSACQALAQGTFQNLDFENGSFVPIPGQLNTVEFTPAMPGWTGYVGTNQINSILYNDLFLSSPGIAIWGPNYPSPGLYHGQYFIVLQSSFPDGAIQAAIAQTGRIPAAARSIQFYASGPVSVTFGEQSIPSYLLGGSWDTFFVYGGDISAYAGQTGELRFTGGARLDYIRFSSQPIPEPATLWLVGLGASLLAFTHRRCGKTAPWSPGARNKGMETACRQTWPV